MISWALCVSIIFVPAVNNQWQEEVFKYGILRGVHIMFSTLNIYALAPMVVIAVLYGVSSKLRNGVFPGGYVMDMEGIEPSECKVVERQLYPENVKEEIVFLIWVAGCFFLKLWIPPLATGLVVFFINLARIN